MSDRILVLYKSTVYDTIKGTDSESLVVSKDNSVKYVTTAHDSHYKTLERVTDFLKGSGADYDIIHRRDLRDTLSCRLAITIGGDGTYLAAARYLNDSPIFGINSSTQTSVGFFCAADMDSFSGVLGPILEGKKKVRAKLERLSLTVDDDAYVFPILNDILVADEHPAGLSRYILSMGDFEEYQRSSGVWVATPAGSSGALQSAGGKRLKPTAKKFQFIVREPFAAAGVMKMPQGDFFDEPLVIKSAMQTGKLFLDGTLDRVDFPLGAVATIGRHPFPLLSY